MQVLHLEPQGRCLNDANARRGRKPFRLSLQVLTILNLPGSTLQAQALQKPYCLLGLCWCRGSK